MGTGCISDRFLSLDFDDMPAPIRGNKYQKII